MSDQKFGAIVEGFVPPVRPDGLTLGGLYARLEPLDTQHIAPLWAAYEGHPGVWDYLPSGPFESRSEFEAFMQSLIGSTDPVFYAIKNRKTNAWVGFASFLRIKPEAGTIEVGYITMSPALQRTRASTEAMALMMGWAFAAGYRRYEWKCNALNGPSRRTAQRLGFSYEGVFRQAQIVKGRNRDTAWFAVIDAEWPEVSRAFARWLDADNFDAQGLQKQRLGTFTAPILVRRDPTLPST